jgi:ATP-binding cassette subfamily B protein
VPLAFAAVAGLVLTAVAAEVQVLRLAAGLVRALEALAAGEVAPATAWLAAGGLVAAIASVSLLRLMALWLWIPFAARVMHALVSDAFRHVQRFGADWHANHFAGSTQRKITRGMWAYDLFADTVMIDLGPSLLLLVGFSIAMFMRAPALGIGFAVGVAIFLAVSLTLSLRYVAPKNERSNDADTRLGGALADAITCNPIVKSFGAEAREAVRLDAAAAYWSGRARVAWRRSIDTGAVQAALLAALLASLLGTVLWLGERRSAPLEDLVYVLTTYFVVNGQLQNVGRHIRNLQRAVNEIDDLVELHRTPPQVADRPGAPAFRPDRGRVHFDRVRFRYPQQPQPVFDDFTLEIAPGEKVAVVGESGAGKSTLVKLLQRLYDVQAGQIRIDGQDIAAVTQDSLRRAIALVPQEPLLFHRSLRENIAYGRPGASEAQIIAAAQQARAHEFIIRLTDGYDALVGERGINLSGGERQRIAIARAILADAPVLVFDEATSSLDSLTERAIQQAIAALVAGRTAILIAHRLATVRRADRILVFEAGRIVEQGPHDALLANRDGVYRRLFEMQRLGFVDVQPASTGRDGERGLPSSP